MSTTAPNPASADVRCVVSPGRGNCTISPQLWDASRKSVADPGQHWALSSAQPLVGRHQRRSRTARLVILVSSDVMALRLVSIELQTVLHVPQPDVRCSRSQHSQSDGCVVSTHGNTELRVISILVILYAVLSDDVTHWTAVDDKQDRLQYWFLRDADVEADCWWVVVAEVQELWSAAEVRPMPRQCHSCHSELCLQALEQYVVAHHVEGRGQVEADENIDLLVIGCGVFTVQDLQQCSFSRMLLAVCRLELAEIPGTECVRVQTCQHKPLRHLWDDISLVAWHRCVQSDFLQQWQN